MATKYKYDKDTDYAALMERAARRQRGRRDL